MARAALLLALAALLAASAAATRAHLPRAHPPATSTTATPTAAKPKALVDSCVLAIPIPELERITAAIMERPDAFLVMVPDGSVAGVNATALRGLNVSDMAVACMQSAYKPGAAAPAGGSLDPKTVKSVLRYFKNKKNDNSWKSSVTGRIGVRVASLLPRDKVYTALKASLATDPTNMVSWFTNAIKALLPNILGFLAPLVSSIMAMVGNWGGGSGSG